MYSSNLLVNGAADSGLASPWVCSGVTMLYEDDNCYFHLNGTAKMEQTIDSLAFLTQPQDCKLNLNLKFTQALTAQNVSVTAYAELLYYYEDGYRDRFFIPLGSSFLAAVSESGATWLTIERICPFSENHILQQIKVTVATIGLIGALKVDSVQLRRSVSDLEIHEINPNPHQLPLAITVGQFGIKATKGEDVKFWLKDTGDAIFSGQLMAATGTIGTEEGKQLIVDANGEVTLPALTITGLDGHPSIQSIASNISQIQQDIVTTQSAITQTASEIRLEVLQTREELQGQISANSSAIIQTADSISLTIQQTREDLQGNINSNTSLIDQTATAIRLEVAQVESSLQNQITANSSSITQTADSIRLEVSQSVQSLQEQIDENSSDITNTQTTLQSSISQTASAIYLEVSQVEDNLQGQINSNSSTIAQTADSIWLQVTDSNKGNTIASEINQTATSIRIAANRINISGAVTFDSLSSSVSAAVASGSAASATVESWKVSGTTTIDGANIATGTIAASKIKTDELIVGYNVQMSTRAKIKWTQVTDAYGNQATAATVGARPAGWLPTPAEIGARPDTWYPTPAQIGAMTLGQFQTEIGKDYVVTGKIYANQIAAGTLTGFLIRTAPTGYERLELSSSGLVSRSASGSQHGVVLSEGNFSSLRFYYYGSDRGGLAQAGGALSLTPAGSASLILGTTGKYTYLRGIVKIEADSIDWGGSVPTSYAVFS